MRVLVLTNEDHIVFVMDYLADYLPLDGYGNEYLVKYTGEYDWSEDYDIGVSFMYQYRVPKEQLSHTWFNFHPAPLPEYKGRNLCYHAIMNGERYFGASIHYMDENFDTGRIIDVSFFPIEESDTAGDVSRKAIKESENLFQRYFLAILKGVQLKSYENVGGRYYPKTHISSKFELDDETKRRIRAITYGAYFPYIEVGGMNYKIVRCE